MRWLPSWRVVLGTVAVIAAVGAGLFFAAYQSIAVPEPDDFSQAETTNVYYADGETLMGSYAEYDRTSVDFATLPLHVGHAVVASEDRTFFENEGIDLRGIARALWNNLRGLPTQGGSTITQQYVERYYVGTTTSYTGKFKEAILAIKIDNQQDKEEILGNYLNTIYFGRGSYGIEVAAQNYFGKPASELTVSESALLAGVIIGVVGTALGYVLGLGVALALEKYQFIKIPGDVYPMDHLPVRLDWPDMIIIGITALALCFLATMYPARQAARLSPVEALRHD